MVHNVSATLLTSTIASWIAAHPDELVDRARVERLEVAQVLGASGIAATDISDAALAEAALLFPRHQQVSLFRFFCHVRAWSFAQATSAPPTEAVAKPASEPVATMVNTKRRLPRVPIASLDGRAGSDPLVIDLTDSEPDGNVPADNNGDRMLVTPGAGVPAGDVLVAAKPFIRVGGVPGTEAYATAVAPDQTRSRGIKRDTESLASTHAGLRCPYTAADLAAMPARRARLAAFEFDLLVETTWAQALSVAAKAARLAGDASWTIETHLDIDKASLWYHSDSTRAPSIHTTLNYTATENGPMISFRILEVHASGVRSLLSRRDQSRPARVLARKLAWGFLPSDAG